MKEDIIKKLYFGELYPAEKIVPKDDIFIEKNRELQEKRECLRTLIDDENGIKEIDELEELIADIQSMMQLASFKEGFKMGAEFMREIIDERNKEK